MTEQPSPYENGGTLRHGVTLTTNTSGEPEIVIPGSEAGGES